MSQPTEAAINVFREGSSLTFAPSKPGADPVFQATSIHPWRIDGDDLIADIDGRSETFTAVGVVLAAKSGWFGFSSHWVAPGFLKGPDAAIAKGTAAAKAKVAKPKKSRAKEAALAPSEGEVA